MKEVALGNIHKAGGTLALLYVFANALNRFMAGAGGWLNRLCLVPDLVGRQKPQSSEGDFGRPFPRKVFERPSDLRQELVGNFKEVQRTLKGTEFEWMLRD